MVDFIVVQPPYSVVNAEIVRDADWLDPLPDFKDGDVALDLTGSTLEIYIRPTYDDTVLLKKLSTGTGDIIVDDAEAGLASISLSRTNVINDLPVGTWNWFCVLTDSDAKTYEMFRGTLVVHPGNIDVPEEEEPEEPPTAGESIYASDYGVVADGTTDDTAAWNSAITYANANPWTTIIAPPGRSIITALTPFTGTGCKISSLAPGQSWIVHSGDEALTWQGGAAYGGIDNIGIDNSGAAGNTSIRLNLVGFFHCHHVFLGTGIGTFAEMGVAGVDSATGGFYEVRFDHLMGVLPKARTVALFIAYNGVNLHIEDNQVYTDAVIALSGTYSSDVTAGRDFFYAPIVAPSLMDLTVIRGNDTFGWDRAVNISISGTTTALGPLDISGNWFDSCRKQGISIACVDPSYLKELSIRDNYISCFELEAIAISGSGRADAPEIRGNRVRISGTDGITFTLTGFVGDLAITDNLLYDINQTETAGAIGIEITGDNQYNNVSVVGNHVASIDSGFVTVTHLPDYGIAISGAIEKLLVAGNHARGDVDNYSLPSTATNSKVEGNIGLTSAAAAVVAGASPYTYTAGPRPTTLYITGGTVSAISPSGAVGALTTTPATVHLGPNETCVITYTVAPTIAEIKH